MGKYVCKTKCFHLNRLWTPGETLESTADAVVPVHFTPAEEYVAPEIKAPKAEPKTFSEAQKELTTAEDMFS
jgi:hypothetical protein